MGNHILITYLKEHPETTEAELLDMYVYFKFKAYLQTTLRCTRMSYCIKKGKASQSVRYLPHEELYEIFDAKAACDNTALYFDLRCAVETLDTPQSDVIKQYYFNDMTDLEISRAKNVSRQAVNSLKRRALIKLRDMLNY